MSYHSFSRFLPPICATLAVLFAGCRYESRPCLSTAEQPSPFRRLSDNLDYGIPGGCDFVIEREGYALGYTSAEDYFEYTIDVKSAGKYKLIINGATGNSTASSVTVSVGDNKVQTEIPSQGDWNTYSEVEAGELELAAGKQTLRLTIDNSYINVDWIKFVASDGTTAVAKRLSLENAKMMLRCQVFDMNGKLVKSANAMAGSPKEAWNNVKMGLRDGSYILRLGVRADNMRVVQVRK
jgi:hypothetical protein